MRTFRDLAQSPPADGSRLLLDGAHLVQEARAAGLAFEHVVVTAEHLDKRPDVAALAHALARDGVDVVAVTRSVMGAISPVRSPSGIAAIAARRPVAMTEICQQRRPLIVAPVDVQDPGNLGALLRAAEAGGATGAVVCGVSAHPFSSKAVRGSMGTVLRLPIAGGVAPPAVLDCARKFGLRAVASVPRGGKNPDAIDWTGGLVVFVGGEGPGLPAGVVGACDEQVTIPMQPPVESLNVAVAAGVLVYEARRQRKGVGAHFSNLVK